ncbi:MAG: hypothetical protein WDN24_10670 [Sphingomonas sp.]
MPDDSIRRPVPTPMPRYGDVTYRHDVGRAAHALAGAGFPGGKIADLGDKLGLFRAIAGLSQSGWPDTVFARLMFGEADMSAGSNFNRKKHGAVALTEEDGAVLAQILNSLGQLPAELRDSYAPGDLDTRLIGEVVGKPPGNSGLRAPDLALPLIEFAGRAAVAAGGADTDKLDTAHRRMMAFLNGLSVRSHRTEPAIFYRQRESGRRAERFGGDQTKPDLPVWDWEPLTLIPGERLLVGLPSQVALPNEIWAVTVRDPRPSSPYGSSGPRCWDEPWENLVRWTVPNGPLTSGMRQEVGYGQVVDLRGEYSLFVLVEHGGKGRIRSLLGSGFGAPVRMEGFINLLRRAADTRNPLGFDCHARRYRIRAG